MFDISSLRNWTRRWAADWVWNFVRTEPKPESEMFIFTSQFVPRSGACEYAERGCEFAGVVSLGSAGMDGREQLRRARSVNTR